MRRMTGFTLIELIATILVIGILSAFISIRTPSTTTFSLSSFTEQIRRDIRYTQTLALSLNSNYSIIFTATNYTINPLPSDAARFYPVPIPTGITVSPSSTITFNSMGAPQSASTITISDGVVTNTLTISPETGFING